MGHYGDQYAEESRKLAEKQAARRKWFINFIKNDIAARGIEEVLTDIVMDPSAYRNRSL